VDTGKDSRIKITDERGTQAAASRQTPNPLARIKAVRQTTGRPRKEMILTSQRKGDAGLRAGQ
jgi:hypothetical protein